MATRTANDLVMAVGRTLGLFHPGETPAASDSSVILGAIQDLLAEWADGGLLVPYEVTEGINLIVSQVSYTVGESGSPSLDTVKPELITGAYVRSGGYDYPVEIIDKKAYDAILNKTLAGRPDKIYVAYTAPNITIYTYPVPDATDVLYITSKKTMTEPVNLTDDLTETLNIPRNYFNALRYNVAVDVAPMFNMEPSATVASRAIMTKRTIISLNVARNSGPVALEVSAMSDHPTGNILTGWS